jgi:hypothetical protein
LFIGVFPGVILHPDKEAKGMKPFVIGTITIPALFILGTSLVISCATGVTTLTTSSSYENHPDIPVATFTDATSTRTISLKVSNRNPDFFSTIADAQRAVPFTIIVPTVFPGGDTMRLYDIRVNYFEEGPTSKIFQSVMFMYSSKSAWIWIDESDATYDWEQEDAMQPYRSLITNFTPLPKTQFVIGTERVVETFVPSLGEYDYAFNVGSIGMSVQIQCNSQDEARNVIRSMIL